MRLTEKNCGDTLKNALLILIFIYVKKRLISGHLRRLKAGLWYLTSRKWTYALKGVSAPYRRISKIPAHFHRVSDFYLALLPMMKAPGVPLRRYETPYDAWSGCAFHLTLLTQNKPSLRLALRALQGYFILSNKCSNCLPRLKGYRKVTKTGFSLISW